MHRISVPQIESTDEIWIYAASPAAPGPHPIVVYAHGQGGDTLANCWPDSSPSYGDVMVGTELADDLAEAGYLGIAVFYRNAGDGSLSGNGSQPRDHYVLDARSLLAAAQWGRTKHGEGSNRVAFMGVSMGTFPAFLAVTDRPDLRDLQGDLDMRLSIIAGMALNHVSNFSRNVGASLNSPDANILAQGIIGVALGVPPILAGSLGVETLTLEGIRDDTALGKRISVSLEQPAKRLYENLILRPANENDFPECVGSGLPAYCVEECARVVALDAFDGLATAPVLSQWITQDALDGVLYWAPPTAIDPTAAAPDSLLGIIRELSPVYHGHEMLAPKVLPLLSAGDHVLLDQGQEAANLLLERLGDLDATILADVPIIDSDDAGLCGHSDYFNSQRPKCGWNAALGALETAFDR